MIGQPKRKLDLPTFTYSHLQKIARHLNILQFFGVASRFRIRQRRCLDRRPILRRWP